MNMCEDTQIFFKQIFNFLKDSLGFACFTLILMRRGVGKFEKRGEGNVRIFGTFYRDPSIFPAIVRLSLRDYFNPTIIHLFIKRSDFILQAYSLRWNRNKWPPKMKRKTIRFDS